MQRSAARAGAASSGLAAEQGSGGGRRRGSRQSDDRSPRHLSGTSVDLHVVFTRSEVQKPIPADAPYRLRSSTSCRLHIKGAAGWLPAGGTREVTGSQRGSTLAWQTMALKAVLLLTLLATLTVSPAKLARSSFWEYLSQLTSDKDSLPEPSQSSKLGRDITNLKESIQDGVSYVGNFLEKLVPLNRGLQPRLYHDSDSLRKLIRKELESLRVKLSPYVDEVHHKVGKHLEDLRYRLQPFTEELLDQVSLKARELRRHLMPSREVTAQLLEGADEVQRFMAHYADKITFHTDQVKDIFQPYADRLVTEIHRNVEELHRNVVPHTQASPEKLNQYIQELSTKLTQNARDLHQKIQGNLEQLKVKLSRYPGSLEELPAAPERYTEELAREVQRRVEEFRKATYLQIQDFTRALDQETEKMRRKLSSRLPSLGDHQEGPPAVEDLHARLDALWRDLADSLSERDGEAP
ncbi:apolipoprotein A-V isoform X1 [Falco cherrug]|uniref:apolipoprotein A-V isoform X1 n=1 Tax=Falco cherrug TaxID=345164 RepID=UPI000FFC03FB|nr:apolipoprotein A-V isoform X1 [Falco cherrug]